MACGAWADGHGLAAGRGGEVAVVAGLVGGDHALTDVVEGDLPVRRDACTPELVVLKVTGLPDAPPVAAAE